MKELSLEEIQQNSYKILKKFDEICKKNNFTYYLAYGTLIGAVRHNGFIPWDDDIDVMMPREDYDKFTEYCHKNKEKIEPLQLFDPTNEKYPYMINRLSDSNYILDVENEEPYGIGLFIDIYPLDGISKKHTKVSYKELKAMFYSSLCFQATRKYFELGHTQGAFRKIFKKPIYIYSKFIGKEKCMEKLEQIKEKCDYDKANYVGCIIWGYRIGDSIPKDYFGEPGYIKFEDRMFPIPKEADKILKKEYGDYMKLPKEKERIPHHDYKAYKK